MSQLVVHWFACNHFYPEWRPAITPSWAPPGSVLCPTAALHAYHCTVCLAPPSKIQATRKSVLMTANFLSHILNIPETDGRFMHGVIRFYARGDHLRWLQPPSRDAKFLAPDPYIHSLMVESWKRTLGRKHFWTRPGYHFDVVLAEVKRSEAGNYECLNWSGANYMPICPYYYVSLSPMQEPVAMKSAQDSVDSAQKSSEQSHESSNLVQTPLRSPESSLRSTQSSFDTARTASSSQSFSSPVSQTPCHEDTIQQVGTQNNTTTAMQKVQTSQVSLPFVRMDPSVALDDPFVIEPISAEGSWSMQDRIADIKRQFRPPGPMVRNESPGSDTPIPSTIERMSAREVNRKRHSETPYEVTSLPSGTSASCDDETWSVEDVSESSFEDAVDVRSASSSVASPVVAPKNDDDHSPSMCNTSDTQPTTYTTIDPSLLMLESNPIQDITLKSSHRMAASNPQSLLLQRNLEHELQPSSLEDEYAETAGALAFSIETDDASDTDPFSASLEQYTSELLAVRQLTKAPELQESDPNEYGFGFGFQHSLFEDFEFSLPEN
ncbi:hypothetical protein ASPBRDRAFT_193230 [Aspergillus brasiliensis CBS 101740]|uniref:Uncharacterized protein n=1 Tax=Aspergillus brasiliensis (strain CBS 101740 / IMI 381727 / IBT 21946) TaxID=767769 RepID=A0A1L9USJ6_ASPBC|nr:hypothetical protein ASPBRDRAFT_193230 [Aspergillus brasiliensis CBS 101740]